MTFKIGEQKIICIGLPKTGTTSLHHAFEILGLRSVHWPHDPSTVDELRKGIYRLTILEEHDAISDVPVPSIFPQLDRAFPGSKFILTTRDKPDWLRSQRKAGFNQRAAKPGTHREFYRTMLYGVNAFNEERFGYVFDKHHALVDGYFSDKRSDDLLKIDISKGEANWGQLCDFLGLPAPNSPFPHSNVAGEDRGAQGSLRRIVGRASALLRSRD